MELMLIVKHADDAATATRHRFPKGNLIAGAAAGCDLQLPGLADVCFSVAPDDDHRLVLQRKDENLELTRNGELLAATACYLENGDVLELPGYTIQAAVAFERSNQRATTGLLPVVTGVLIAVIIIIEILVAVVLPRQIGKHELWAEELVRQKTLEQLDYLRGSIRILGGQAKDEDTAQTMKLIKEDADRMAFYLRRHHDELTTEQLQVFRRDITTYQNLVHAAHDGTLYPTRPEANMKPAMQKALDKEVKTD